MYTIKKALRLKQTKRHRKDIFTKQSTQFELRNYIQPPYFQVYALTLRAWFRMDSGVDIQNVISFVATGPGRQFKLRVSVHLQAKLWGQTSKRKH